MINDLIKRKIQHLIYKNPLYRVLIDNIIHVTIIGEEEVNEFFVNSVLRICQLSNVDLILDWYIDNDSFKDEYLGRYPALDKFLVIDGIKKGEDYAKLNFIKRVNKLHIKNSYIFKYGMVTESFSDCFVSYYDYKLSEIFSIDGNNPTHLFLIGQDLERIAFNVHMVWSGQKNYNISQLKNDFKSEVNYYPSMYFALSIQYKLWSMGISYQSLDDAALKASEFLKDDANKEVVLTIANLEHRRWILDRALEGIQPFEGDEDFTNCVKNNSTKIYDNNRIIKHPCMVPSSSELGLEKDVFKQPIHWDVPSANDDSLDNLDSVSLKMHRVMYAEANKVISRRKEIFDYVSKNIRMNRAKQEFILYEYALRYIFNHNKAYSTSLGIYEKKILALDPSLKNHISYLHSQIFPLLQSNLYIDYKKYDYELVKKIPFILSYKTDYKMMAFIGKMDNDLNASQAFENVASASVIYPSDLSFVYIIEEKVDTTWISRLFTGIHDYFESRGMDCKLNILFLVKNNGQTFSDFSLNGYKVDIASYNNNKEWIPILSEYIKNNHIQLVDVSNCSQLPIFKLRNLEELSNVDFFTFDSENKIFEEDRVEILSYKENNEYLTFDDVNFLIGSKADMSRFPEFGRIHSSIIDYIEENPKKNNVDWLVEYRKFVNSASKGIYLKDTRDSLALVECIKRSGVTKGLEEFEDRITFVPFNIKGALGDFLELHVFFECLRLCYFDDIKIGVKVNWGNGSSKNELDSVLIKGFKMIIVECKDTSSISSEFYYKLNTVANHFGIHFKKIMLGRTAARRATDLGIEILPAKQLFSSIGNKLVSFISGQETYLPITRISSCDEYVFENIPPKNGVKIKNDKIVIKDEKNKIIKEKAVLKLDTPYSLQIDNFFARIVKQKDLKAAFFKKIQELSKKNTIQLSKSGLHQLEKLEINYNLFIDGKIDSKKFITGSRPILGFFGIKIPKNSVNDKMDSIINAMTKA